MLRCRGFAGFQVPEAGVYILSDRSVLLESLLTENTKFWENRYTKGDPGKKGSPETGKVRFGGHIYLGLGSGKLESLQTKDRGGGGAEKNQT